MSNLIIKAGGWVLAVASLALGVSRAEASEQPIWYGWQDERVHVGGSHPFDFLADIDGTSKRLGVVATVSATASYGVANMGYLTKPETAGVNLSGDIDVHLLGEAKPLLGMGLGAWSQTLVCHDPSVPDCSTGAWLSLTVCGHRLWSPCHPRKLELNTESGHYPFLEESVNLVCFGLPVSLKANATGWFRRGMRIAAWAPGHTDKPFGLGDPMGAFLDGSMEVWATAEFGAYIGFTFWGYTVYLAGAEIDAELLHSTFGGWFLARHDRFVGAVGLHVKPVDVTMRARFLGLGSGSLYDRTVMDFSLPEFRVDFLRHTWQPVSAGSIRPGSEEWRLTQGYIGGHGDGAYIGSDGNFDHVDDYLYDQKGTGAYTETQMEEGYSY